ncbi:hypothetical protein CTI14_70530, partial [Methylobacterium radiotolerans]
LTGRANYRKATQRLRALGLLLAGQDLETNPDLAFCGRGLVQLTGRANYRKATQRLRALGLLLAGQDLETNPDLA